MAAKCKLTTIKFKTKRGRVIAFKGHSGSDCAPRKKPSTRHLAPWKKAMKIGAHACAGSRGVSARRACIAKFLKAA